MLQENEERQTLLVEDQIDQYPDFLTLPNRSQVGVQENEERQTLLLEDKVDQYSDFSTLPNRSQVDVQIDYAKHYQHLNNWWSGSIDQLYSKINISFREKKQQTHLIKKFRNMNDDYMKAFSLSQAFENYKREAVKFLIYDENRINTFIEILNVVFQKTEDIKNGQEDEILLIFEELQEMLEITSTPIITWKDQNGMTLLMAMVIKTVDDNLSSDEREQLKLLIESIIRRRRFNYTYVNQKATYDLAFQFQLQHFQGVHKKGKKKCTVIDTDRNGAYIRVKQIRGSLLNAKGKMKEDQIKVVSQHPIYLKNTDLKKKVVVTGKPRLRTSGRKELVPEHFDTSSVKSIQCGEEDAVETTSNSKNIVKKYETKGEEFEISSDSTKIMNIPSKLEPPNKYFSQNTTVLLLACKTKCWNVVKAILETYPLLFYKDDQIKNQKKHPLYDNDDSKANCLHLAIEDEQTEIYNMIIERVDKFTLKTSPIADNKPALKFVIEKISKNPNSDRLIDLQKKIRDRINER